MATAKLTVRAVTASPADPERDRFLWDTELRGFGVRITRAGQRSWVLQYSTDGGQRRRITLGPVGSLTLAQARRLAAGQLRDVMAGLDPAAERKRRRQAPTLADLEERFLREHGSRRAAKTVEMYRSAFRELLAALGSHHPVESLRWEEVSRVHAGLADRPCLANRTLATISVALNLAKRWGWFPRDLANPAEGHEPYPERRRGQVVTRDQLGAVGRALALEPEDASPAACLRLLILTGARPRELMRARWEDVAGDGLVIRLPESKTGPRNVYLGRPAAEILATWPRSSSQWIFPGTAEGKPIYDLKPLWRRVQKRASLPDGLRIYDLVRHSFITRAAGIGIPLDERKILSGHAPSREAHFKYLHQLAADGSLTEFGQHLVEQADQVADAIFADLVGQAGARGARSASFVATT